MQNIFTAEKFGRTRNYVRSHKILSLIALVVVLYSGYKVYDWTFGTGTVTRYVLASVERGTIVSSVSGTGQVSASSQIDLKARASGNVVYVMPVNGKTVPAGTLIAQIDTRDALNSLESARIAYQKLVEPANKVTVLQAENAVADAVDSEVKSYSDGFVTVTSSLVDFSSVLSLLDEQLNSYQGGKGALNDSMVRAYGDSANDYRKTALNSFYAAKNKYDANQTLFKSMSRDSSTSSIAVLVSQTYDTAQAVARVTKDARSLIDFIQSSQGELPTSLATAQSNLVTQGDKANADVQSLLSAKSAIDGAARQIRDKRESLAKIRAGADTLDVQAEELSLQQKEFSYQDYFVRAPFDGVLAKLSVRKNESTSGGSSVGTFISKQKIADISLNEVDVAKVKIGQPATLTFDAIDGLTITGKVVEVDLVGTVSSGVVNYNVKIAFDLDDARVRSGMSVSASIVTDTKQDVLLVSNSAVKVQGSNNYVEVLDNTNASSTDSQGVTSSLPPRQQNVTVGISNDTDTEIVSGLKEGEMVVTRTITSTAKTTTQSAPSILNATGGSRNSGAGALRAGPGR